MKLDTKKAPEEVKRWFRRTEEITGMSKSAIVTGIVMDILTKSKQNLPRPKHPKKPAA